MRQGIALLGAVKYGMTTILAIETSTELASVAILHGDQVYAREAAGVSTHSQTVLPMVQSVLAQAGLTLAQCDAIAFGSGPGSFTGVRTACGVVQGLAFAANLPVLPIVTLAAMALRCQQETSASDILAVLDARMGEVYWAQYRFDRQVWQTVVAPSLSAPSEVVTQGEVIACGNGLAAYATAFATQTFAQSARSAIQPHAKEIALLARLAYIHGQAIAPNSAQPFYLRNKIALTTAERQEKARERVSA